MPLTQVQIESENKLGPLPGYLSSGQHKAAVIVIQEAWGVTDQIKGMAERVRAFLSLFHLLKRKS